VIEVFSDSSVGEWLRYFYFSSAVSSNYFSR
jgi:hypothetical protein